MLFGGGTIKTLLMKIISLNTRSTGQHCSHCYRPRLTWPPVRRQPKPWDWWMIIYWCTERAKGICAIWQLHPSSNFFFLHPFSLSRIVHATDII